MGTEENREFLAQLEGQPALFERFKQILAIAENETNEALTADEIEELVFQEVRKLGLEVMQGWAVSKHKRVEHQSETRLGLQRRGKKNSTGKPDSGKSQ